MCGQVPNISAVVRVLDSAMRAAEASPGVLDFGSFGATNGRTCVFRGRHVDVGFLMKCFEFCEFFSVCGIFCDVFMERSIVREVTMLYINPVLPVQRTKNSELERIKQRDNLLFTTLFHLRRKDRMF